MQENNLLSELLSDAVDEFSKLPSIGKKTALRLVLHLLRQPEDAILNFTQSLTRLKNNVKFCKICNNISDEEICPICQQNSRKQNSICIVEGIKDVMSIEQTGQYSGLYHVLGGIISPMDGIGPNNLSIDLLENRINKLDEGEIIFALPATMEGDTTCFYIHKRIKNKNVKFSTLARGISIGDDLEYADELTLGRSIINRVDFTLNS
jgi:recombination protein RecR